MKSKTPESKEEVKELLEVAAECLFSNQPDIFDFTSESGDTEWNLAHHYANEVSKFLAGYDCDLEITKRNFSNKRPDIIFHKRSSCNQNFLVVEVKRNGSKADIDSDMKKIQENWFQECLCYQFGAVVNLKSDKTNNVAVCQNISEAGVE